MFKLMQLIIEQMRFKRAQNILARQKWSIDFIIYLLRKAQINDLTIRITEPDKRVLDITMKSPIQHTDYYGQEERLSMDEMGVLLGVK